MKAIIGYGDALLFFLGDYDWSYAEKQRRMRARTDVADELKTLYDQALEFRFAPDYAPWLAMDLDALMARLRVQLEPVCRLCESKRLGVANLAWRQYPQTFLRHVLLEDLTSPIAWAQERPQYPSRRATARRTRRGVLARVPRHGRTGGAVIAVPVGGLPYRRRRVPGFGGAGPGRLQR